MDSAMYTEERRIASLAVHYASLLTKSVMRSITHISKNDSSPVTVADFAVQCLLIGTLSQAFPRDSFLGEESAAALRADESLRQQVWELVSSSRAMCIAGDEPSAMIQPSSPEQMMEFIDRGGLGTGGRNGRTWIMDPIDGTATFIEGGQYAVAVALIDNGKEVLGVVGCPNLTPNLDHIHTAPVHKEGNGFMVSAVRGDGGVLVQPITTGKLPPGQFIPSQRLPSEDPLSPATSADLNFVDSKLGEDYHMKKAVQFAGLLGCTHFPGTEVWSTQIRLIIIALGKNGKNNIQIRIPPQKSGKGEEDPENYIWDYAGAHLILQEAGGLASDLDGAELDFGTGRRLSANWGLVVSSDASLRRKLLSQFREFLEL
ncbi:hypothetical protein NLG97_g2640 [Lecanicillium saksenae]|uniref:Uncharacterized protein n=1 Tax=Lecanicillium saksenae TaxID=468837 RepID=A0ACC1R284_9HYPO|nr:hypothetical protein NLG97_g2640 [Lecanicillium saksenae]